MAMIVAANPNGAVAPSGEHVQPPPLDVATALTQQFIHKLRARNADKRAVEEADQLFRAIRFEDYEESCSARMMQFDVNRADEVIQRFCASNGWNERTSEDLKFAAALLDEDRKAETWIKFQKGNDGEFYVHFVAMRRAGEKVHMGLARHHVKFRLSPYAKDSDSERRQSGFFNSWYEHVDETDAASAGRRQDYDGENGIVEEVDDDINGDNGDQRSLSLHEMEMLENYFLIKAMIKFTETFPVNSNQLPETDRSYLTMGPSD